MKKSEGLSVGQAAIALHVSPKTIRRRIQAGQLPYKLVPGKYGDEYRLTEIQGKGVDMAVYTGLDKALAMIETLQAENRNLAMQLGRAEERLLQLTDGHRPWWKRIFK